MNGKLMDNRYYSKLGECMANSKDLMVLNEFRFEYCCELLGGWNARKEEHYWRTLMEEV